MLDGVQNGHFVHVDMPMSTSFPPQRLSYFFAHLIPLSLILFVLAFLGFLISDDKKRTSAYRRAGLLLVLFFGYCGCHSRRLLQNPLQHSKMELGLESTGLYISFAVDREQNYGSKRWFWMMVPCASTLIVTGGIKTAAGGGGYGCW
jgi:hypothetical protein